MEKNENLYKQIANSLIDWYCEKYSSFECVELLLEMGFSRAELEEVYFDTEDIDLVEKRMDEE